MEKIKYTYSTKMLGLVTLYNPAPQEAAANILRYIHDVDALIIWDNSPLEARLKEQVLESLAEEAPKVIWHGDGQNRCIAPAINYAWRYAKEHGFELLLLMDQDSLWEDFASYRKDIEKQYYNSMSVFTPYVVGCDTFSITAVIQEKFLFINSGTIIPTEILSDINHIDENAFPLDALDNDLSLCARERGYKILCLTNHKLHHSLGQLQHIGFFNILTPNYNSDRTYSIIRSHVICYRKHRALVSKEYRNYFYGEIIYYRLIRIIFAEQKKWNKIKAFIKGFISGLSYKLSRI